MLISSIGLGACSTAAPQSSETLGTSTASASNTDGTSDTAGQASVGPTSSTDSPTTGLDPTNDTGTSTQATAVTATTSDGTTLETGTGAPSTDSMSTTDETTTTGETTDPGDTTTGETGTEGTTGSMGGGPCEVDADCKLHDDCCSCYGLPNDQNDPVCRAMCDVTQCQQIGIDEAKCVLGECTTEKVDCSSEVACDSLPPDCPPGTLPGVDGACWSGACVPVVSCAWVPDCELCPDSFMCVSYLNVLGGDLTCLPLPAACGGEANCDCAAEACVEPFDLCTGAPDVDLACDCPNC